MSIEAGELKRHPDYGLVNVAGSANVNITTVQGLLVESIETAITVDDRFDRIETFNIQYFTESRDGQPATGFDIQLEVRLVGSERTIPISFTVTI